jgi:hypothetical protein
MSSSATTVWSFSPVDPAAYAASPCRVLLLSAEPHGAQPTGLPADADPAQSPDMGPWFATASAANKFHGNLKFYRRCLLHLHGALDPVHRVALPRQTRPRSDGEWRALAGNLRHLRYVDVKNTPGGKRAKTRVIVAAACDALNEAAKNPLVRYWTHTPEAPHVTVVMGGHAHEAWLHVLRPHLAKLGVQGHWALVPHASDTHAYDPLFEGVLAMRQHLRPISDPGGFRLLSAKRGMSAAWVPAVSSWTPPRGGPRGPA